jgi:hypothetical protein
VILAASATLPMEFSGEKAEGARRLGPCDQ